MNYIFDIGNVLVDYKPLSFLETLFTDKPVVEKMNRTIFLSSEWLDLDHGIISREQAIDNFCKKEPEYTEEIKFIMERVNSIFTPITDTIELLPIIKESGHGLYYLSNMQNEIRNYLLEKYDFFTLFDGGVFSCDVHMIKPSKEIYRHLLTKYNIDAKSCVFFDDMNENILAANKENINGILFTDAECVRQVLAL